MGQAWAPVTTSPSSVTCLRTFASAPGCTQVLLYTAVYCHPCVLLRRYAVMPYAVAQGLVEVPFVIVQSVLYGCITYFMIQFEFTARKVFW